MTNNHTYSRLLLLAGVFVSMALGSCSRKVSTDIINGGGTYDISKETQREPLKVDFLGVTAFGIQYKDRLLLTDPYVSPQPSRNVMFKTIHTDSMAVDKYYNRLGLENTRMVICGHAHYDHLLDLPYLADKLPGNAVFCGNSTMKNLIMADEPVQQVVALERYMGDTITPGTWIYSPDSSLRIMPFESDHLKHFMGIELYKGDLDSIPSGIPTKAKHWRCGTVISYLIDFMEEDEIAWRIFFHSSSPKTDIGLFPPSLLKEKSVDVVMGSVALNSEDYVIRSSELCQPTALFMTHWENFFIPKDAPYRSVSKSNINKSYQKLEAALPTDDLLILPEPGSTFIFR